MSNEAIYGKTEITDLIALEYYYRAKYYNPHPEREGNKKFLEKSEELHKMIEDEADNLIKVLKNRKSEIENQK